jgi:large subunit ribosomal protein L29
MKYEDLKGKSADELSKMLLESKKELFNLRFQRTTGELEKTHRFRQVRKDVARINTFMSAGGISAVAPKAKKEVKAAKAEKASKAKKEKKEKKEKVAKTKTKTKTKKKAA